MPATDRELADPGDDGHEDDGEEGGDVEDLELAGEAPGEAEGDEDREEEDDVGAGGGG